LIKQIKEMRPWPLVLSFRSHCIHERPWFLQGLCRQALGLHSSDSLERSFLKIDLTEVLSRASHLPTAAAGRLHPQHPKSRRLPTPETHTTLQAEASSNSASWKMLHTPLFLPNITTRIQQIEAPKSLLWGKRVAFT